MSIKVSVPLDALENPDVARALSLLMLSLGGVAPAAGAVTTRTARPARASEIESAPARALPAPAPAPARRRRAASAAPKTAPRAIPARPDQSYADFVANLPAPSRRFLDLIEKHGNLRLSQAVRELGITRPKTLGGITGSLTRWARQRGVELPYKAGKSSDGERVWTWTRGGKGPATTAKRTRARRRASGRATGASRSKSKESESAPVKHKSPPVTTETPAVKAKSPALEKKRPDVTGREILRDDRYQPLVEGMTDTAKRFLVALSDAQTLTMTQALEAIERKRAKSVGDAVRAYVFRARERGTALPFDERAAPNGERMWIWKGVVPPEPTADDDVAEKPARPGVRVIRGGRGRARGPA